MPIWTLCMFIVSMLTYTVGNHSAPPLDAILRLTSFGCALVFCGSVLFRGLRRPVV